MRPDPPRSHPDTPLRPPCFEALEARQLFAVDLGGSLIAHWTFEDTDATPAQFADVSPGGSDQPATRQGDAVLVEQDPRNQTLQLDGSGDYLAVANSADINLGIHTNRSVAFWFRVDDASLSSRKQIIYEEGGTTRGLVVYVYADQLYVGGWNTPGSESGWAGTWLNTAGVESGRWHHVALTLDGQATTTPTALSGYLDGQRFAQGVGSQLWSRSGSITLGNHSDGTRFHDGNVSSFTAGFAGQLDDGRLYNRTLQPADVVLLARGPAEALARLATAPPRLAVHDIPYTLAPDSGIDTPAVSPPQRLNAEQTPDFPGLALEPAPGPATPNSNTPLSLPDFDTSELWAAVSQPLHLWPELSVWLTDQAAEDRQPSEVVEVNPDAAAVR